MTVFDLNYEQVEYGYRFDGLHDPHQGHHFDPEKILLDPDAMEISGRDVWKQPSKQGDIYPLRGRIPFQQFDWAHARPLKRPESEMIIYEMHLRGFTAHESSAVKHPGTFDGLREKIGYLKDLVINCVELMPIFGSMNSRTIGRTRSPAKNSATTGDIARWDFSRPKQASRPPAGMAHRCMS
jgi:glycogen operon protein